MVFVHVALLTIHPPALAVIGRAECFGVASSVGRVVVGQPESSHSHRHILVNLGFLRPPSKTSTGVYQYSHCFPCSSSSSVGLLPCLGRQMGTRWPIFMASSFKVIRAMSKFYQYCRAKKRGSDYPTIRKLINIR